MWAYYRTDIQKRMGSRLKALKCKTKKLTDGKSLGDKECLINAAISLLQVQKCNELAMRRNCSNSVLSMYKSIWGEFYHFMSSKEDPKHGLCSEDDVQSSVDEKESYDDD